MELRNKKVLVTGACGFIGSHLVERLLKEGCKVRALVYYNSFNNWGWMDAFPREKLEEIDVYVGDIRDYHGVKRAIESVDLVFHLAALIGIPYSYHSPDSYIDTNIRGTLNILQASRDSGVKMVLVTSTSEVYGTAEYVPIDEDHPKKGQSPYSATKIGADSIAESFYRSFDLPVVIVRPFNTFGPRQSARAVIPTIISQLLSGKNEIKLGSLKTTRDLVFIDDTVEGFLEIAKSEDTIGEEINISTQTETSIGDVATKLIDMINHRARIVTDAERIRPEKSEVDRLMGNNEKIRRLTSWRPKYGLDSGLKETIEWMKQGNVKLYKPNLYNI
jgi:NAD dependent epimerase/dehydratase